MQTRVYTLMFLIVDSKEAKDSYIIFLHMWCL